MQQSNILSICNNIICHNNNYNQFIKRNTWNLSRYIILELHNWTCILIKEVNWSNILIAQINMLTKIYFLYPGLDGSGFAHDTSLHSQPFSFDKENPTSVIFWPSCMFVLLRGCQASFLIWWYTLPYPNRQISFFSLFHNFPQNLSFAFIFSSIILLNFVFILTFLLLRYFFKWETPKPFLLAS